LVFAEAGVEYEDERITYDPEFKIYYAWRDANKDKVPFGQLPILIDEGLVLAQSITIARYLAQKYGLRGKDEKEAALADAVVDQSNDLDNAKDINKIQLLLGYFENWLQKSTSGFFTANLTYADLLVFEVVSGLLRKHPEILKSFPLVEAHHKRIGSRPRIEAWLKKRPESIM